MTRTNRENIIIVEFIRRDDFIEDIFNRGYNPVLLDTRSPDSEEGRKYKE